MHTILGSKTYMKSPDSSVSSRAKGVSVSAPLVPINLEEIILKTQTSAPAYFCSLKDNEAPPFKKPEREPNPRLVDVVFTEVDVVVLMAAAEAEPEKGLQKYLGEILVRKKILENFNLSEKSFLTSFLSETINYAAQRDFGPFKLACLLTLYTKTHLYFKWYYWQSPVATWHYFKEILIRHTIEDSPDGQEVFQPEECYDILTHFHNVYLTNLPLIHIITFGAHRLKLLWPFKLKQ